MKELADVRIPDNQSKKITAANVREQIKDLIESSYNKAEDEIGLNEYNSGLTYKPGAVCVLGKKIYQANKTTQGAFKSADWNEIAVDEDLVAAVAGLTAAMTTKEDVGVAQTLVTSLESALKGGVAVDGDTLAKLRALIAALRADVTFEQAKVSALQALVASDDMTLDSVQELVNYIKANKSLIDSVTTNKIDKADIVDNLNQTTSGKVLDARQGKILADRITTLEEAPAGSGDGQLPTYSTPGTITLTVTQPPITENFVLVDAVANPDSTVTLSNFNLGAGKLVKINGYGTAQGDLTIMIDGFNYYFDQPFFATASTVVTIASTKPDDSQLFRVMLWENDLEIANGSVWGFGATVNVAQNPRVTKSGQLTFNAEDGFTIVRGSGGKQLVLKIGDDFVQMSQSVPGVGITNILAGGAGATLEYVNTNNGKSSILSVADGAIHLTGRSITVNGDQQETNVGGLVGSLDFSPNYTDTHYVQKAYVDNAVANAGGGGVVIFNSRSEAQTAALTSTLVPGQLYKVLGSIAGVDILGGDVIVRAISEYQFDSVGTMLMLVPDYDLYEGWGPGNGGTTVIYNNNTFELNADGDPTQMPPFSGSDGNWTLVDNYIEFPVAVGLNQTTLQVLWVADRNGNHVNRFAMYGFPWGCPRFTHNKIEGLARFEAKDARGTFRYNRLLGNCEVKFGEFQSFCRIENCSFEDQVEIAFPNLRENSRWLFSTFKGEATIYGDYYNAAYFISTEIGSNATVGGEVNGTSYQYSRIHRSLVSTPTDNVNIGLTVILDRDEHTWPKAATFAANGDLQGDSYVGRYIITPATANQAIGVVLMPINVQAANVGVAIDWTIRLEAAAGQSFRILKSNTHFRTLGDNDLTLTNGQYATFLYYQVVGAWVQRGGKQ